MTTAPELGKRLRDASERIGCWCVTPCQRNIFGPAPCKRDALKVDLIEAADLLSSPIPAMDEAHLREVLAQVFEAQEDAWDDDGATKRMYALNIRMGLSAPITPGLALEFARRLVTVDEWQPIESAPKDEQILVCGNLKSGGYYREVQKWWKSEHHKDGGFWPVVFMVDHDEPTHWRPLPNPPQAVRI